jgi:hypothetical protein
LALLLLLLAVLLQPQAPQVRPQMLHASCQKPARLLLLRRLVMAPPLG